MLEIEKNVCVDYIAEFSFKVFDLDENDEWRLTADWKTHAGSVWKVNWAHPEFGQILATCSFDRTAAIWEEIGL